MGERSAPVVGVGIAYVLVGAILLLRERDLVTVRWSLLGPGLLIGAGLVVLLNGAFWARSRGSGSDT